MKTFEEQYYEAPSFWAAGVVKTGRLKEIAALIPHDAHTLLDVGCGNGAFGHYLMEHRSELRIVGVDRSDMALSHVTFEKKVAPIDDLPFDDRSFDVVSCLQVLEHLNYPTSRKALAELARVAGRQIIVEVPYDEDTAANLTECPRCRCQFNVDLHLDHFDDARLSGLLEEQGFVLRHKAFPDRKEHLVGLDRALNGYQHWRAGKPRFMSPICPLCGYTEGDRTASVLLPQGSAGDGVAGRSSLRRTVAGAIKRYWPRHTVKGYSVVGLYERA